MAGSVRGESIRHKFQEVSAGNLSIDFTALKPGFYHAAVFIKTDGAGAGTVAIIALDEDGSAMDNNYRVIQNSTSAISSTASAAGILNELYTLIPHSAAAVNSFATPVAINHGLRCTIAANGHTGGSLFRVEVVLTRIS
jgi:hypothetical protein